MCNEHSSSHFRPPVGVSGPGTFIHEAVHSPVSMSAAKNRVCVSLKHDDTYSVIGEHVETRRKLLAVTKLGQKRHRKRLPVYRMF